MNRPAIQAPSAVVMIRPHHFHPNPQTIGDNSFQQSGSHESAETIATRAKDEVSVVAASLESCGVRVHLFDDASQNETPDSVFPNNWFSTHDDGRIAIYPMYAANRRLERRTDVIEMLKVNYQVQDVVDYSNWENEQVYLEGTGAMVLDHIERVAYMTPSNRANVAALNRFCAQFQFEPIVFETKDPGGKPIYHTNVLMCIATEFAMLGTSYIQDQHKRQEIVDRLVQSGRACIELDEYQITQFAGNALELTGGKDRVLALSSRAFAALKPEQKQIIEKTARILPLSVPTIELAGGSVRCMLAGVHLLPR